LLFRSEDSIEQWCNAHHLPRGATLSLEQIWDLAQRWYQNRLSPNYRGRSAAQAEAIFTAVGLEGPFWHFNAG
jgi:hypothetical protein